MKNNKRYRVYKDGFNCSAIVNTAADVYNILFDFAKDGESALKACKWAENADIGEVYEIEDFVVEVICG